MGIIGRHVKIVITAAVVLSFIYFIGIPQLAFGWFLLYHTEEIECKEKWWWVVWPIVVIPLYWLLLGWILGMS